MVALGDQPQLGAVPEAGGHGFGGRDRDKGVGAAVQHHDRQIKGIKGGVDVRELPRLAADFAHRVAQVPGEKRLGDRAQGHKPIGGAAAFAEKGGQKH